MKGIIRRYVSEYIKNPHDFIVGANNPDVVMAKDAAVRKEILSILEAQLAARITQSYQQYINEGNDSKQFGFNLIKSVVHATAAALGFTLAIVLFAFIREGMETNDIPEPFHGFPIALITASLISFAFLGFSGMV